MFLVIGEMYVRNNRLTNADTKVFNSIFLACCTDIDYKRLNRCGTSILALGAGGISKCVMREEEKILRAPNIANIEQYIDRVDEMIERKRIVFAEKAKKLD